MRKKVPVSKAALMARINRRLAHDGERFKASRSAGEFNNLGNYYTIDLSRNMVVNKEHGRHEDWFPVFSHEPGLFEASAF